MRLRRFAIYQLAILGLNLAWEIARLALYTISTLAPDNEIASAVFHCTLGDVLIAGSALIVGWFVSRRPRTSIRLPLRTVLLATGLGLVFTVFSEWRATQVTHAWEYSPWMPILPVIQVGLTPVLQWIMLPPVAIWIAFGPRTGPLL